MPRPTQYFVRVWTVDPEGEGPDDETDTDIPDSPYGARDRALRIAKQKRRKNLSAGAFERRNIRRPDHIPHSYDIPAHLFDCESVQIDEDEIDREYAALRSKD